MPKKVEWTGLFGQCPSPILGAGFEVSVIDSDDFSGPGVARPLRSPGRHVIGNIRADGPGDSRNNSHRETGETNNSQSLRPPLARSAPIGLVENPNPDRRVMLRCPVCCAELGEVCLDEVPQFGPSVRCRRCFFELRQKGGIWNALLPERQSYYSKFIREYEIVRAKEGWGSNSAAFYLALPHKDLTNRNPWVWKIRSRSFLYTEGEILPALERQWNAPLSILDLGAGNGWLSYRLSLRGHFPIAVDLLTNELDGLGAAAHYSEKLPNLFPRFQAELDRLPFADACCDCVIFNASIHYSEDYARTVGEAVRCLRPEGTILIVDSPWYSKEEFGQQMVQERRNDFKERFGFLSAELASLDYLTDERLSALSAQFGIRWTVHRPWYGFRWAMRPWVAKWKGKREPAEFRIYAGELRKT
jgi:SAM-dependent methyltransferase